MTRGRSERGQTVVTVVLFMVVILGMMGAVLDLGSWFRADRQLQNVADAAALAAAQELPDDTGTATAKAVEYAAKNGGAIGAANVVYSTTLVPNDTVQVTVDDEAPTVFTKIFGIDSVTVHATAKARTSAMGMAKGVAPIAVDIRHPMLQCAPEPCFGQTTTLDLKKTGPGAFRLLNLDDTFGGSGQTILADWIQNGYSDYLPLDWYFQDAGAKFNASQVTDSLNARLGDELLFPVYDSVTGGGSNFEYHVVGWVGFVMTGFNNSGSNGTVTGYFTELLWDGIESSDPTAPTFGARTVSLIQ